MEGYKSSASKYQTEQELIEQLNAIAHTFVGKTAILAGHFFLLYDQESDSLYPAIEASLDEERLRKVVSMETNVGDFPMKSWNIGTKLLDGIQDARIIMLVNDQKFRTEAISALAKKAITGRGSELRQRFFQAKEFHPSIFHRQLVAAGKSLEDVLVANNDLKRKKRSTLPKQSFYFAESVLSRRFNNYTMDHLLKLDKLYCLYNGGDKAVHYKSKKKRIGSNYCISGNNSSPCIAISLQLFWDLLNKKDITNIIMLVPEHCEESVNYASEMALNIIEKQNSKIIVVSGLEEYSRKISLKEHLYEGKAR